MLNHERQATHYTFFLLKKCFGLLNLAFGHRGHADTHHHHWASCSQQKE
jgi:hypothetical protein